MLLKVKEEKEEEEEEEERGGEKNLIQHIHIQTEMEHMAIKVVPLKRLGQAAICDSATISRSST